MKARHVLDALDRVALFRSQAGKKAHRGRVEEIGDDLDSALSLLDLRQSRQQFRDDFFKTGGTISVVQGVNRVILDWSTGVIVKLSGGLLRPSSTLMSGTPDEPVASSAKGSEKCSPQADSGNDGELDHKSSGDGGASGGGDGHRQIDQREVHDRNARRWLSDARTWQAFVRSLTGCAAADPSTQLPQSAGVAVLRAAVFTVRHGHERGTGDIINDGEGGGSEDQRGQEDLQEATTNRELAANMLARKWAFMAICTLCGGVTAAARAPQAHLKRDRSIQQKIHHSVASKQPQMLPLTEASPAGSCAKTTGQDVVTRVDRPSAGGEEQRDEERALLRMSLDAFVTFLEEVIREGGAAGGDENLGKGTSQSLVDCALTQLLRFQVRLQGHQSNRRKVFSSCCSKLMGPLFEMLHEADSSLTVRQTLVSVTVELVWDALFHEEHLEGYREAFTAAEATTSSSLAIGEDSVPPTAETVERGGKKRRRRGNKSGSDAAGAQGSGAVGGDGGRGGTTILRRACYQQQLLEEMGRLVAGVGTEHDPNMTHLSAVRGAPLLLEGFIVRLIDQSQNNKHTDIHQAVSGGIATAASGGGGPISSMGGKRPRSSAGISTHVAGGGPNVSPASLMFKMWTALTGTLFPMCFDRRKEAAMSVESRTATPAQSPNVTNVFTQMARREVSMSSLVPFLRSSNDMLQLLVKHDVYRVNEDWGGREFKQLEAFATTLFDLAGNTKPAVDHVAVFERDPCCDIAVAAGAPQEFIKAFHILLEMNHNILHDKLRPLLRMAFDWAAMDPAAVTADNEPVAIGVDIGEAKTAGRLEPLRPLAVSLVVSLVDTYGRLRQMDHLVQALFGATSDSPSASAAMLGGDECKSSLGRAFQRLPEGQIESMWHVFASHLRSAWTTPAATPGAMQMEVDGADGEAAGENDAAAGTREKVMLARELDGDLFVLFLRNLHVTSSVAVGVGVLCSRLAEESLRSFSATLHHAAAAAAGVALDSPSSSSKKKEKKKKGKAERAASNAHKDGAIVFTSEAMLALRPTLDIHGWLLDLDTRCRFWSAIVDSHGSALSLPESIPMTTVSAAAAVDNGDNETSAEPALDSSPIFRAMSEGELPRIIEIAADALRASGSSTSTSTSTSVRQVRVKEEARVRLTQTLQQVAIHRVQQIYARLNGAAALEGGVGIAYGGGVGEEEGREGRPKAAAAGSGGGRPEDERLESEARGLVEFACASAIGLRAGERRGEGGSRSWPAVWGDENEVAKRSASWRMMMPYLPVWVGFAAREQVEHFVEALFSRCAADVLAGRSEEDSAPLRLLSDASFFEMEAVAESAPVVILGQVYRAIKAVAVVSRSKGNGQEQEQQVVTTATKDDSSSALRTLVEEIQSLGALAAGQGAENNQDRSASDLEPGLDAASVGDLEEENNGGEQENRGQAASLVVQGLLEACCLVMLTERFPPGFLDEEAVAGLLVASDALDSVCFCSLSRSRRKEGADTREEDSALIEALTGLRSLMLRLGISLPSNSPFLDQFSPGPTIVRVVGRVGYGRGEGEGAIRAAGRLLHASASLAPYLASRCLAVGQADDVLNAGARLEPSVWEGKRDPVEDDGEALSSLQQQRRPGLDDGSDAHAEARLVLLHGITSGIVAGESARLSAVAAAAFDFEEESNDEDAQQRSDALPPSLFAGTNGSETTPPLFGLIARLANLVPPSTRSLSATSSSNSSSDSTSSSSSGETALKEILEISPSLLLVWGDALRLSFLGGNAGSVVFPCTGVLGERLRSRWAEDVIFFLRARTDTIAAAAVSSTAVAIPVRVNLPAAHEMDNVDEPPGSRPRRPGASDRSACCRLLRAVCGCSHLLDRPFSRHVVVVLVETFLLLSISADTQEDDTSGHDGDSSEGQPMRYWGNTHILQSAFCLLVQHAPETHLHAIVQTLVEMLDQPTSRSFKVPRVHGVAATNSVCTAVEDADNDSGAESGLWYRANVGRSGRDGRGPRGVSVSHDHEHVRSAAVTLLRLVTQAGRGSAFVSVMQKQALPLTSVLCKQLGLAAKPGCGAIRSKGGHCRTELAEVTGALDALEGLLGRFPYATLSARVVAVVLGSLEAATSAAGAGAMDRVECNNSNSSNTNRSRYVHESSMCLRACCRVLGALLLHYSKKVYSCTPAFAAVCRSLLRLFFCLAARAGRKVSTPLKWGDHHRRDRAVSSARSGLLSSLASGADGGVAYLFVDDQVAAANALSRVLQQFVPHKEVLKKYAAFLLLEYVSLAGATALDPKARVALLAGIFAVMEACSPREMRQLQGLLGGLPNGTGLAVFRSVYEEYQRQHKYTGKM